MATISKLKKTSKPKEYKYKVVHSTGQQGAYSATDAGKYVTAALLRGITDIQVKPY